LNDLWKVNAELLEEAKDNLAPQDPYRINVLTVAKYRLKVIKDNPKGVKEVLNQLQNDQDCMKKTDTATLLKDLVQQGKDELDSLRKRTNSSNLT